VTLSGCTCSSPNIRATVCVLSLSLSLSLTHTHTHVRMHMVTHVHTRPATVSPCTSFSSFSCAAGMAPGNPHEASVTDNVMAAYDFAVSALHWDPKNIIIFGRSIGTGVSMSGPLSLCWCPCIRVFVCIAEVFSLSELWGEFLTNPTIQKTLTNPTIHSMFERSNIDQPHNSLIHTYTGPAVKLCAELDCGGLILVSPYTAVKDMVIVCIRIPI
jgi:hypothetical protein